MILTLEDDKQNVLYAGGDSKLTKGNVVNGGFIQYHVDGDTVDGTDTFGWKIISSLRAILQDLKTSNDSETDRKRSNFLDYLGGDSKTFDHSAVVNWKNFERYVDVDTEVVTDPADYSL